ncbi:DUF488 domain-containing protein [Hyphomicrobium sp.]|uniref:DUF488 domain-containing protein n=1 Tax=Hyphomicrobium sp. TaxID=82 RepID=UPI001D537FAE|nr:DUF488 domain-containing protein [Hyphomicrobium sp.]
MTFGLGKDPQNPTSISSSSPRIVTSSWSVQLDPTQYCRVGISRGAPRRQAGYRRYPALAPGSWFRDLSPDEFRRRYNDEILNRLDPKRVIADLEGMAERRTVALLCFEPPTPESPWCHRGLVALWLYETLALRVSEFGQQGCCAAHPKLHPAFRRDAPAQHDLFGSK